MPRTLLALLVALGGLTGQDPVYTVKVGVPLVSVDVTVTDTAGKTVSALKAPDFQILENGVPQEIQYFSPVSSPYNILLLFDRSGSTEYKWPFMQRAVAGLISSLRPQDRLAIDAFASGLETLTRWSDPREKAIESLGGLMRGKAIGETDFYGSLENVVRREFKSVSGRRAVVVLTDGRDTSLFKGILRQNRMVDSAQDKGYQKTLKAVREARIPVYFVAIDTDKNLEPGSGDEVRKLRLLFPDSTMGTDYLVAVRNRMERLAEISGGQILFPNQIGDIVALYERIGRELGTSYSLGYVSTDAKTDGSVRRIEVRLKDGSLKISQSRSNYIAR